MNRLSNTLCAISSEPKRLSMRRSIDQMVCSTSASYVPCINEWCPNANYQTRSGWISENCAKTNRHYRQPNRQTLFETILADCLTSVKLTTCNLTDNFHPQRWTALVSLPLWKRSNLERMKPQKGCTRLSFEIVLIFNGVPVQAVRWSLNTCELRLALFAYKCNEL